MMLEYVVRSPWDWVMTEVTAAGMPLPKTVDDGDTIQILRRDGPKELPSAPFIHKHRLHHQPSKPSSSDSPSPSIDTSTMQRTLQSQTLSSSRQQQRRRRRRKKQPVASTLRLEITLSTAATTTNSNKEDEDATSEKNNYPSHVQKRFHHGVSQALDGLQEKDELVRTIQKCCPATTDDWMAIIPPTVLLPWDVSREECYNLLDHSGGGIWPQLHPRQQPHVPQNCTVTPSNNNSCFAVLKEPMGSRGDGVYFVQSVEEIYAKLEEHRARAMREGQDFLDGLMENMGRIPSWVLQAEVYPSLLIRGGRYKFHIRSYIVVLEDHDAIDKQSTTTTYLYGRHEVRIAGTAVVPPTPANNNENNNNDNSRDRRAHITNGSSVESRTERVLLHQVEELVPHGPGLERFVCRAMQQLQPDLEERARQTATEFPREIRKFALAGLDIMMTPDGRFHLLEVNVNPAAPPSNDETLSTTFRQHLVDFMQDLVGLVVWDQSNPLAFLPTKDILQHGRCQHK